MNIEKWQTVIHLVERIAIAGLYFGTAQMRKGA